MRKVVLLAALAIVGLIAMAPAAQAQTQPFSASFKGIQTPQRAALRRWGALREWLDQRFRRRHLQRPAGESWARLGLLSAADRAGVHRPQQRTGLAHAVGGRRPVLARQVARHPGFAALVRQPDSVSTPPTRSPMEPGSSRERGEVAQPPCEPPAHRTSSRSRECSTSRQTLGNKTVRSDGIRIAGPVIGLRSVVPSSRICENAASQERRFHVHRFIPTPPVFGSVA